MPSDCWQIRDTTIGRSEDKVLLFRVLVTPLGIDAKRSLSRMQSIEARKEYKNTFTCATRILKDEGVLTFWSGALPRLARLIMSGGIVFTM